MSVRVPGALIRIVEATMSPHPVDRYLELVDPMLTWRDLRARAITVEHPTARTTRLRLRPTRQWKGHRAGQFVQLSVVIDGVRHTRCFSPANAHNNPDGLLELTITASEGGLVSQYLRQHAQVGDVFGLSPASGDFVLPAHLDSAVFISGGSGITPVLSMLRTLLAQGFTNQLTFVHYCRGADDLAYRSELQELAAAHPNLDVAEHHTRGDGGSHFEPAHLAHVAGLKHADVFVCGPASLLDAVRTFYGHTYPHIAVRSESFSPMPRSAPDAEASGTVTFTQSRCSVDNDGRSLLEQAEGAGLSPASGCRMGICFSCTTLKRSGTTRNVMTGETDSEPDTQIQLCINAPVGDAEIEV